MCNLVKNKKGITLIALVITIIVLLILAGVTIATLTGENGLLEKASKAEYKTSEGEAKEKLQLEISDLITEKTVELKDATIDDLIERLSKDTSYQIKKRGSNKLIVGVDGYAFMLDENLKIVDTVDISLVANAEMNYIVKSTNGNTMNIQVIAKSDNGLDMIVTPDEQEIKSTGDDITNIKTDYSVTVGQEYIFKVKIHNIEKMREFKLIPSSESIPKIANNNDPVYPVLTENGVKKLKEIKIDYGTNTNKYYSVDNGETWLEYKDKVVIDKNCTLMAKSFSDEDVVTKIDTANIEIKLAGNALGGKAYDKISGTYEEYQPVLWGGRQGPAYLLVDPEMIGKNVSLTYTATKDSNRWGLCDINFFNNEGSSVGTTITHGEGVTSWNGTVSFSIPNNCAKIKFSFRTGRGGSEGNGYFRIYEIK